MAPTCVAIMSLVLIALPACSKRSAPASADGSAPPAPTPSSAAPSSASGTARGAANPTRTDAAAEPGGDVPAARHVVVGVEHGAIELWAESSDDGMSYLMGRARDANGWPSEPPRRLRKTSGSVFELVATRQRDGVWIAWASDLGASGILTAAMNVDAKLAHPRAPVTLTHAKLANVAGDSGHEVGTIRIAPRASGDGVLVATAAPSGEAPCVNDVPGERCTGPGWDVYAIPTSGSASRILHRFLDGGPNLTIAALVDVGGSAFASAWTWNGGAVVDEALVEIASADAGAEHGARAIFETSRPPYTVDWTGRELVAHYPSAFWEEAKGRCPTPGDDPAFCDQIAVASPSARGVTKLAPVVLMQELCKDGHPVISFDYDPPKSLRKTVDLEAKSGAFVAQFVGWTGAVLLGVADDGSITRRACDGARLTPPQPVPKEKNAVIWEVAENVEQLVYCLPYPASLMSIADQGHPHGSLVYAARGKAKHAGGHTPKLEFSIMSGSRPVSAYFAEDEAGIREQHKGAVILTKVVDAAGYVLDWRADDVIHRTKMWLMPRDAGASGPDRDFVLSTLEYPAGEDAIWAPVAEKIRGASPVCPPSPR